MSNSAPFATAESGQSSDSVKGGRRKYEAQSQKQDAPFATNYPDNVDGDTPKKQHGRRRYKEQDAKHDAPFATSDGEAMFTSPKANNDEPVTQPESTGRQKPIKPQDNAGVFRYDGGTEPDTPSKGGKRRFQKEHQEAPFATMGDDNRNGDSVDGHIETPRSAGGRRRFEDKLQKKPAPFALDDDSRFKDSQSRSRGQASDFNAAGARKVDRNIPPPNSTGEGQMNASRIKDCPFALN